MQDDLIERWGIRWNGPTNPICERKDDGFWTPWHIAAARIAALEADNARLRHDLDVTGVQYQKVVADNARLMGLVETVGNDLHKIDREANGIRKDKAARVSAIARATLAKIKEATDGR